MINGISTQKLFEIDTLFKKKTWEVDNSLENFSSLYNRYCQRLSLFDESHQDLIIELSYNFLKIGVNDYPKLFLKAFHNIAISFLQSSKHIYILPLELTETNKIKSSHFIWYYLKNNCDFSYEKYFNKTKFIDSVDSIKRKLINKSLFIFLDDFLGTGETAETNISKNLNIRIGDVYIPSDRILLISLAAQIAGIERINNSLNIPVYSGTIRKKGISDEYKDDELLAKIDIMNQIEDSLKIEDCNRFGYGRSEGLITLGQKSPNNTFPVFWHETKSRIAPFPRYKKYEKPA